MFLLTGNRCVNNQNPDLNIVVNLWIAFILDFP